MIQLFLCLAILYMFNFLTLHDCILNPYFTEKLDENGSYMCAGD